MSEESLDDLEDYNTCIAEKTEKYLNEGFSEAAASSMAFTACEDFLP